MLTEAQVLHLHTVTPDGHFSGNIIARLQSVADGNLAWEYLSSDNKTTTVAPGSGTALRSGEKKIFSTEGQILIGDRLYSVLPGYSVENVNGQSVIRDLKGSVVSPIGIISTGEPKN
jgi:hypothetical protein